MSNSQINEFEADALTSSILDRSKPFTHLSKFATLLDVLLLLFDPSQKFIKIEITELPVIFYYLPKTKPNVQINDHKTIKLTIVEPQSLGRSAS